MVRLLQDGVSRYLDSTYLDSRHLYSRYLDSRYLSMCLHCLARHVPGPGTVWQAADRQLLDAGHTEHQTLTYTYLHWTLIKSGS